MKIEFKLIKLIAIVLLVTSFACSDDEPIETIIQDLVISIDENPTSGQSVGTIQVEGVAPFSFSIDSQTPGGALNIDESTGELTVADADLFDFETNPVITATVSVDGAVNTGAVTINLNDLNEISVQDLSITIDENYSNGQTVGIVPVDGVGPFSLSIDSQTPIGALAINESTGELTVADTDLFDFETNPVITATVSVDGVVNTGSVTINLNNVNEIGDFNYGGVVFWVDPIDSSNGLVCAVIDQSSSIRWHNTTQPSITGTTSESIQTGSTNTDLIIASLGSSFAAGVARAYNGGGFNDWFLPSVDELKEMSINRAAIDATAAANSGTDLVAEPANVSNGYWSSSQQTGNSVYLVNLLSGGKNGGFATNFASVRAVRSF